MVGGSSAAVDLLPSVARATGWLCSCDQLAARLYCPTASGLDCLPAPSPPGVYSHPARLLLLSLKAPLLSLATCFQPPPQHNTRPWCLLSDSTHCSTRWLNLLLPRYLCKGHHTVRCLAGSILQLLLSCCFDAGTNDFKINSWRLSKKSLCASWTVCCTLESSVSFLVHCPLHFLVT